MNERVSGRLLTFFSGDFIDGGEVDPGFYLCGPSQDVCRGGRSGTSSTQTNLSLQSRFGSTWFGASRFGITYTSAYLFFIYESRYTETLKHQQYVTINWLFGIRKTGDKNVLKKV